MKISIFLLAAGLLTAIATPAAATEAGAGSDLSTTKLDTVLVTGEQPGPGLWKVSRGDHVLWILGVFEPLPKQLEWRNDDIEAKIAQSQEVIGLSVGKLAYVSLLSMPSLRSQLSYQELPDRKQLRDVLSPQLYARWSAIKARYAPHDDDIDHLRPAYALNRLYDKLLDQAGLEKEMDIWKSVLRIARRHHVHVTTNDFDTFVRHPNDAFRQLAALPLDSGLPCFERRLPLLENDLRDIRLRANAWATGDLQALLAIGPVEERFDCAETIREAPALEEALAKTKTRLVDDWLRAADAALARNRSTVAVQLMSRLLAPDGVLAALRAKGYTVEEPD